MFGSKKTDAFFTFYYSNKGKKIVALADAFLGELLERMQQQTLDVSYDYRLETDGYCFKLIYSVREKGFVYFFVEDQKTKWNVLELVFSSTTGNAIERCCCAFYPYKKSYESARAKHYALFLPLFEKMNQLVIKRFIDVSIPCEQLEAIEAFIPSSPVDITKKARHLVQENRASFSKNALSYVAFTVKKMEQIVPRLESERRVAQELKQMLLHDFLPILEMYTTFSPEERIKQQEKLLLHMNRFYLKAIDVEENVM